MGEGKIYVPGDDDAMLAQALRDAENAKPSVNLVEVYVDGKPVKYPADVASFFALREMINLLHGVISAQQAIHHHLAARSSRSEKLNCGLCQAIEQARNASNGDVQEEAESEGTPER